MRKAVLWSLGPSSPSPRARAEPELKTEEQKPSPRHRPRRQPEALAAVSLGLSPAELELVKAGSRDGVLNKDKKAVDLQVYGPKIQEMQTARASTVAAAEKKAGQAFLDKAAAEKGATKTSTGLVMTTIKEGTGPSPKATDKVKVHYQGTLTDGTVFDSSLQRNEPATFPLNGVIPCWTEAVQLMNVGGKSRLVCPEHPPTATARWRPRSSPTRRSYSRSSSSRS
jgi:FKBP-type peptidyl-prolyl cis-trans isomerase FkpA/FKBP-type peptidyl-prolyl cis-trans isomerase FklB